MDKEQLAEQIGDFATVNGIEETGKFLSRMLLGLAYHANASKIEFDDDIGSVVITPREIEKARLH